MARKHRFFSVVRGCIGKGFYQKFMRREEDAFLIEVLFFLFEYEGA